MAKGAKKSEEDKKHEETKDTKPLNVGDLVEDDDEFEEFEGLGSS